MDKFLKDFEKLFIELYDFKDKEKFSEIVDMWVNNKNYYEIAKIMQENNIYNAEKICNKTISYDYSFFIGSFIDICKEDISVDELNYLKTYQKMIKYGLNSKVEVDIYEHGLADRAIVHLISKYFNDNPLIDIKQNFIDYQVKILEITDEYPTLFSNIVNKIINT